MPMSLKAGTRNRYSVPLVNPVIVWVVSVELKIRTFTGL